MERRTNIQGERPRFSASRFLDSVHRFSSEIQPFKVLTADISPTQIVLNNTKLSMLESAESDK